jgi:hypothetical protein
MLTAKVRFALLFSTVAFRLVEIGKHLDCTFYFILIASSDCRLEQGNTLLVSPAYWLSSVSPDDFGTLALVTKPLIALLTAMVLAGLRDAVIRPISCDLESLGQVLLSGAVTKSVRSSETGVIVRSSGASKEQVRRYPITSLQTVTD